MRIGSTMLLLLLSRPKQTFELYNIIAFKFSKEFLQADLQKISA
jgi:hypothetical protein